MPLVSALPWLTDAKQGRYAIGAFNAHNLEFVQGVLRAAEELESPVILQLSARAINYAGLRPMASLVRAAAQEAKVPVVMHLDHGDYEMNLRCLVAGFTSLMFDGSRMPLALNAEETRRVVEAAHVMGVPVEGELGHVGGKRVDSPTDPDLFTTPDAAQRYVALTGVDSLAIHVGQLAMRDRPSRLDAERVRAISDATNIPLTLPHVRGLSDEELQEAIAVGICKISVGPELNEAFTKALRTASAQDPDQVDCRPLLAAGRAAVADVVRQKIKLFGSAGRAREAMMGALPKLASE